MKHLTGVLFAFFIHLGGLGLLILGVLDSSFLFMPLGNDLLLIAMTARRHGLMPYYAAMATVGSVLGCLLMDIVSRKGGEEFLEKRVSKRRLKFVEGRIKKNAGWALGIASLMPPPFPFTPFVIAAAATEYPRKKLLTVIAITRMVRFTVEGTLAILFGSQILHWAKSSAFQYAVIALMVVAILGSVLSVLSWVRKSGGQRDQSSPSSRQFDAAD